VRSDKVVWIGLAVLLIALRTTILLLGSSTGELSGDAPVYFKAALHLVETGTLPPLGIQPRGYPVLISPIIAAFPHHAVVAVQIFEVFLDVALVSALGVIAWRTVAPYSVVLAGLTVVAVAIQPFTATMIGLYTEPANTFLLTASLLMFARSFVKATVPVAASFLLGLSAITRTELIPLAVAFCGVYWLLIVGHKGLQFWRSGWMKQCGASLVIMLVAAIIPLMGLIALQAASTGEFGVIRWQPWNPGYYAWMRTWFADRKEYPRFHFDVGQPGWEGFRLAAYPKRASANNEEQAQIAELLKKWQAETYTPEVDEAFAAIAKAKRVHAPVTYFLTIPLLRMAHFWINLDGAQSFLRVVHIQRPYSLGIVGITVALRAFFILFAAIGAVAVWKPTSASHLPLFLGALGRAASILIALRTVELGILGTLVWGGLMEIRFANITFPAVILLAIVGVRKLTLMSWLDQHPHALKSLRGVQSSPPSTATPSAV